MGSMPKIVAAQVHNNHRFKMENFLSAATCRVCDKISGVLCIYRIQSLRTFDSCGTLLTDMFVEESRVHVCMHAFNQISSVHAYEDTRAHMKSNVIVSNKKLTLCTHNRKQACTHKGSP